MLRSAAAPGHAVVVNPPVYPPFVDWVAEAGMRCAPVPLALDGGTWTLDLDGLERAFAAGAAAYLLCNPHNPVGRVHTPAELASVVDLARRYGVLVVSDEVHAPLTLPGAAFTPLLTVPGAAEVAVSLLSASKAFNLAGLKCAAVVSARGGPDTASILATSVWHCGHLGVVAGIAAFSHGDPWLDALLDLLVERRSELGGLLSTRLPTVSWQPPQATYLAWTDWRATGLADPGGALLAAGVALDPGPRFGPQGAGWMRLNFATSSALLDEATRRMAVALES
jgi:cystathionine beta-lyase